MFVLYVVEICLKAVRMLTFEAKFSKHIFPAAETASKMSFSPLKIDLVLLMFRRREEAERSLEKVYDHSAEETS